jgi:hypothetical protein
MDLINAADVRAVSNRSEKREVGTKIKYTILYGN